ncbi:hypothetical protein SDC9_59923 [bioreactor metagenome]|uniref:Uncharacterized protein n=1 Tax=bioreactor metagenome TaxID=1076179 RepID=A0A644XBH7_9ZZZZ
MGESHVLAARRRGGNVGRHVQQLVFLRREHHGARAARLLRRHGVFLGAFDLLHGPLDGRRQLERSADVARHIVALPAGLGRLGRHGGGIARRDAGGDQLGAVGRFIERISAFFWAVAQV